MLEIEILTWRNTNRTSKIRDGIKIASTESQQLPSPILFIYLFIYLLETRQRRGRTDNCLNKIR